METWERAAAWIERDLGTTRRASTSVLTEDESVVRKSLLTWIWQERVGHDQTVVGSVHGRRFRVRSGDNARDRSVEMGCESRKENRNASYGDLHQK